MPCNGIAVVSGVINANLTELFFELPEETRTAAIVNMLTSQIPELAGKQAEKLPWSYDLGATDYGLKIGNYLIGIYKNGNVFISVTDSSYANPATQAKIEEAVRNLVKGIAGLALQQQTIAKIKAAGAKVTGQQKAKNGAVVLSLEF